MSYLLFQCNNCPGLYFFATALFSRGKNTFCQVYFPKTVWLSLLIKMVLLYVTLFLCFLHCVEHFPGWNLMSFSFSNCWYMWVLGVIFFSPQRYSLPLWCLNRKPHEVWLFPHWVIKWFCEPLELVGACRSQTMDWKWEHLVAKKDMLNSFVSDY